MTIEERTMPESRHAHIRADEQKAANRRHGVSTFSATLHCLIGCGAGEVLGMVIGRALSLSTPAALALSVGLAFVFGYSLTTVPLLRSGVPLAKALGLAFAADTFSIAIMEIVDNGVMLVIPGALQASPGSGMLWGSLTFALIVAALAAHPVNRWLIARGRGHAVLHANHPSRPEP